MMTQVQVLVSDPDEGHLKSPKVTKSFLFYTFDWEEMQIWKWSHCVFSHQDALIDMQ